MTVNIGQLMKNFSNYIEEKIDGRLTTTISSSSTDDEIPTAKAVNDKIASLEARITQLESNTLRANSIMILNSPKNNTSINTNDTLNITGFLVTTNGEPIESASIVINDGEYNLDVLITDSNGEFSTSVNGGSLSIGQNSLILTYAGDSIYANTSIARNITVTS